MRAILVGLLGLFVFALLCPFVQLLVLGADRAGYYPPPRLSVGYAHWLLSFGPAALLTALPTVLLMWWFWRLLARGR